MSPQDLIAWLRSKINPIYADQIGTESHERKTCANALELLIGERDGADALHEAEKQMHERTKQQRDELLSVLKKLKDCRAIWNMYPERHSAGSYGEMIDQAISSAKGNAA